MPEYVWNGIGLTAPAGWEPSAIERDGLTLARSGRPVCELKWNRVEGDFPFEKHLKRLTRGNRGAVIEGVPESETPAAWSASLAVLAEAGLRARSFLWQDAGGRGLGAALHHPGTGLACLVQFFVNGEADEAVAAGTLATLRDYGGGKTLPWIMFGLGARVPAAFVLDSFSFRPGHYRVAWWRSASGKRPDRAPVGKGPGTRLLFERFAPASVLLKARTLADWAGQGLDPAPPPALVRVEGPERLAWRGASRTSLLRRVLRREVHTCGKVWTVEPGNAILAVTASGSVPAPESVFNAACGSFALVPEEAS